MRLPYDQMFSGFYSFTQGRRDVLTGDFPLNATAPRIVLKRTIGRGSVLQPRHGYPRARRRDVDMLIADDAHLVNLRIQKTFALPNRRIELSADVFNLFNSGAAFGFLSVDDRSANFGVRDSFVAARVGQIGVRLTF